MINDQAIIDFLKRIAHDNHSTMILNDYGDEAKDQLVYLSDAIENLYKYLNEEIFKTITVYIALNEKAFLDNFALSNPTVYQSYENITQLKGENIVIEVRETGVLHISVDYDIDVNNLRDNAIVYQYETAVQKEVFYGKTEQKRLTPVPGGGSYFVIQAFKDLEAALSAYGAKIALYSTDCDIVSKAWFDENRIFFKNGPEHTLRDSLVRYLKWALRNTEVRPEQIVDRTHPVDIKVTWALANRLALIEIKWLGKSLKTRKKFTKRFFDDRARKGATQLKDYLDSNLKQAPTYVTKGYLVIFDARRGNTNTQTTEINQANGYSYRNKSINYNPEYHKTRGDFATPVRFFMEPVCTP